jgi:Flp pilus assembly protein TadG
LRKVFCREDGTAILEFAVVLPLFLAVLLGTINFALLLNNRIVAQDAAREAANTAALTGDTGKARQEGEKILDTGFFGSTAKISVEAPRDGKERIESSVTYTTPVTAAGLGALLGGNLWDNELTLTEKTSYYVEYRYRTEYRRPTRKFVGYKR